MSTIADAYLSDLIARLAALKDSLAEPIKQAEDAIVETAKRDGLVYVFGTGHSHMLAEEVHFRAGGLALTVPILAGPTMLHDGAVAGTAYERMDGIVGPIMDRYPIGANDVLFVSSNSGVNAAPLEAARIGKARGATVIAITSVDYSTAAAKGRERLADLADIVLDNGAPPGDAVIAVPDNELKVGPVSTALGVAVINAILAGAAARLSKEGEAPIYLSANMPGAKENNERLIARYRPRNPHL
ncbi:sugar isomerase domain-containing protein [Chelativorans sp. ZYF759]|uniref:SIS domain-containing protein n=1 Tax=Chelativorans sp. ZYF759 TaxID=2692213 RepID=UPI00145E40D2|nr:SIS domain-containing protein [Chelativorans sp. ZYF759]NMG40678.1 sugar isomerase domain-containing protein [Chelativorans sp. ZYF759]